MGLYVVFRHGSNAANQSMVESMAIGFVETEGRQLRAPERAAALAAFLATEGESVYVNQWCELVPASRVTVADREDAEAETRRRDAVRAAPPPF